MLLLTVVISRSDRGWTTAANVLVFSLDHPPVQMLLESLVLQAERLRSYKRKLYIKKTSADSECEAAEVVGEDSAATLTQSLNIQSKIWASASQRTRF